MSLWNKIYWAPDGEGGGGRSRAEIEWDEITAGSEKKAEATGKETKALKDLTEAARVHQKLLLSGDAMRADRLVQLTNEIQLLDRKADRTKEANKAIDYKIQSEQQELQLREELLRIKKETGGLDEEAFERALRQLALDQEALDSKKEGIEIGKDLGEAMFGLATASKQADLWQRMLGKNMLGGKGIRAGFSGLVKPAVLMHASMSKAKEVSFGLAGAIIKTAFAIDTARSQFMKTTGAGLEYAQTISNIRKESALYGVDAAEAGQAVTDLFTGFSGFTKLTELSQRRIGRTVSLLAELGVATSVSATNLDIATKSLGMNTVEAEELLLEIKATSDAIGLPAGKLAQDFAASAPILSKYGKDMMSVFEGLAKHSKNTGIEINQLLSITGKFDTFEDAGRSVGRLNAILGGPYLNSIDMLNATDEERISILQRLTKTAGLQFDELNRFERMAIADALGMSVDEANRIFGATTAQFEKQRLAQKQLADQAAEAQTVIDQLKGAFNAMMIDMQPLIEERILPLIRGLRHVAEGGASAGESIMNLTRGLVTFASIAGVAMIAAGVIGIVTTGGAAAPWAIPLIASGFKLGAVGVAGSIALKDMDEASARVSAGIAADTAKEKVPESVGRIVGHAVSPPKDRGWINPIGKTLGPPRPAGSGGASGGPVSSLDQETKDLMHKSAEATQRLAAAIEKSEGKPAILRINSRNWSDAVGEGIENMPAVWSGS